MGVRGLELLGISPVFRGAMLAILYFGDDEQDGTGLKKVPTAEDGFSSVCHQEKKKEKKGRKNQGFSPTN